VETNYYSDLEDELKDALGSNWARVSFQNVQYATVLQEPQDRLWQDMTTAFSNDLDARRMRQFFLFGFGDAGSLEYSAYNDKLKYLAVQKEIQSALRSAYIDVGQDKSKPVVIIAHSLGCQVISNYLWDAGENKYIFEGTNDTAPDELQFLKLKSLSNLITTGCNIPLFISGISERKCFSRPNDNFKWDNYYDPDDVLGWPLRQLGPSFEIVADHDVNVGSVFTSWNPLSHGGYWSDKDVLNPLAKQLMGLLS
ncbi:MAG: hypothetical protein AAF512_22190, partial [Pseudomonadota bacterium]